MIETYFAPEYHSAILRSYTEDIKALTLPQSQIKNSSIRLKNVDGLVTGYIELSEFPEIPPQKTPTKADCENYQFMSMVQLCNIAQENHRTRSSACRAFGGDNGDIPVRPERQARVFGYRKFVLVSAVKEYFSDIGIDW